jgi:hypothetical protein
MNACRYTVRSVPSMTSTGSGMVDVASFIEVGPLGQVAGLEIVHRWLDLIGRRVTDLQRQIVTEALDRCSYPLYARLIFDQVRRWHSYDPPPLAVLQPTVQGAIGHLYEQMEEKFGRPIVRHSLAYVTAARHGLTESELEHILSLDDRLLNAVFGFWKPPVRRIPPLLWTRLRADLGAYVVERSADGGQRVLGWYHRQFAAAARQRYLTPQPNDDEDGKIETKGACFAAMIHEISAEFFSGRWGGGKPKPFRYTDQQVKRFALSRADAEADRKVPRQPYQIDTGGSRGTWINRRRLSEYPWHLLHAGSTAASATAEQTTKLNLRQRQLTVVENIKRRVFFDYNWLYSKLKSGDNANGGSGAAQGLIDELEYFMELDRGGLGRDSDMRTLVATLRLIRPYVDRYPESLGVELAGRLAGLVGSRRSSAAQLSAVDRLLAGCDRLGAELCPLRPVLTCFESADLGLRANVAVRSTEPWIEGGAAAVVCNRTMTTVFVIDYDDHGLPTLSTWDLETGDRVAERVLVSGRQLNDADKQTAADAATGSSIVDIYIEARLIGLHEDHLLALYVPRYYGLQRERSGMEGFADVIRLSDGAVIRTLREFLSGQPFRNSLLYLTDNWVAIRYGWGVPLFNLWKDAKVGLTKPHALSKDESKFVLVRSKKVGMKSHHGEVSTFRLHSKISSDSYRGL